jgi:hypothetical protein
MRRSVVEKWELNEVEAKALAALERLGLDKMNLPKVFAAAEGPRRLALFGSKEREGGQLKLSKTSHPCAYRLLGRQCPYGAIDQMRPEGKCLPPSADHTTLWLRGGKPFCLVTQPYSLSWETMQQVVEWARALDLRVEVSSVASWHFPGWTLALIITAEEAERDGG